MKEYLVKNNGVYTATNLASSDCIEIPEGATMLLYCESNNGLYHFANAENKLMATYAMKNGNASWYGDAESYIKFGAEVVWRREQEIKMKEYLRKNINGEFELIKVPEQEAKELHADSWLEVPDGADFLTCLKTNEETVLIFWKEGYKKCLCCDEDWVSDQPPMSNYMDNYQANIVWRREKTVEYLDPSDWSLKNISNGMPVNFGFIKVPDNAVAYVKQKGVWSGFIFDMNHVGEGKVLWQRHTQPEELPFIDDEPATIEFKNGQPVRSDSPYEMETKSSFNSDDIKYMDGCAFRKTQEIIERNASDIADAALKHIRERAVTYDQVDGERSAAKTAKAFNAITGKDITESEVWLMLQLLKDVRQWSRDEYHVDSAEDCIAYAALKAESLEKSNGGNNQGS